MRKVFIRKVCKGFRPRLSRVIAAEGGHIESYYCNNPNKCTESPICLRIFINRNFGDFEIKISKCNRTLEQPNIMYSYEEQFQYRITIFIRQF